MIEATATKMLELLPDPKNNKDWPSSGDSVGKKPRRLKPDLLAYGIEAIQIKSGNRKWTIRRIRPKPVEPETREATFEELQRLREGASK